MSINTQLHPANIRANQELNNMVIAILKLDSKSLPISDSSKSTFRHVANSNTVDKVCKIFDYFVENLKPIALRYSSPLQYGLTHRYQKAERTIIKNVKSELEFALNDYFTCCVFACLHNKNINNDTLNRFLEKKILFKSHSNKYMQSLLLKKIKSELTKLFKPIEKGSISFRWIIRAYRVLSRTSKTFERDLKIVTSRQIIKSAKEFLSEINEIAPEQVTPLFMDTLVAAFFILKEAKCEGDIPEFILDYDPDTFELEDTKDRLEKCSQFRRFIFNGQQSLLHPCSLPAPYPQAQKLDLQKDIVPKVKSFLSNFFDIDEKLIDKKWLARAIRVLKGTQQIDYENIDILESSLKVLKQLGSLKSEEITVDFLYRLSAAVLFLDRKKAEIPESIEALLDRLPFDIKTFDTLISKDRHLELFKKSYFTQITI